MTKKEKLYFPELFQGEDLKEGYFEGWYFKHSNKNESISFIVGISLEKGNQHAFIQAITNEFSEYVKYSFSEFSYSAHPFYVKIGESYFSKEGISIHIARENVKVFGEIEYANSISIRKSKSSPNIMGPFAYCNFLECYHGVISLYHTLNGILRISAKNKERLYQFSNEDIRIYRKRLGNEFPKIIFMVSSKQL